MNNQLRLNKIYKFVTDNENDFYKSIEEDKYNPGTMAYFNCLFQATAYQKVRCFIENLMLEQDDTTEVKHGTWKLNKDGSGTCSLCRRTQKDVWDQDNTQNFCGHCGADMR